MRRAVTCTFEGSRTDPVRQVSLPSSKVTQLQTLFEVATDAPSRCGLTISAATAVSLLVAQLEDDSVVAFVVPSRGERCGVQLSEGNFLVPDLAEQLESGPHG